MSAAPSTIPELVHRVATATPNAMAITAPGRSALSYRELEAHVARTAATLAGGLTICTIPGNHLAMLQEPHVQVLSRELDARLGGYEPATVQTLR